MDLNNIQSVLQPRSRAEIHSYEDGDAFLAGGTWLFSEPQPHLTRLVDLTTLGWEPLRADEAGLTIAATCTIAELDAFAAPAHWHCSPLIGLACRAFLASFKIWNVASVGGNLCMGLPAGPMISLTAALNGRCEVWTCDGGSRWTSVMDFVRGPHEVELSRGEVLRSVHLPASALMGTFAFRRASLSALGRSGVLLIGTREATGFNLTITASTRRPVRLSFPTMPNAAMLASAIDANIPASLYYDDMHGKPDWRRHMTRLYAEEIRTELVGQPPDAPPQIGPTPVNLDRNIEGLA